MLLISAQNSPQNERSSPNVMAGLRNPGTYAYVYGGGKRIPYPVFIWLVSRNRIRKLEYLEHVWKEMPGCQEMPWE